MDKIIVKIKDNGQLKYITDYLRRNNYSLPLPNHIEKDIYVRIDKEYKDGGYNTDIYEYLNSYYEEYSIIKFDEFLANYDDKVDDEIDLCEMLKGHEGETFYSRAFGYIQLEGVYTNILKFNNTNYTRDGRIEYTTDAEQDLFPSKDQRNWNKWNMENNYKTPKTWSELENRTDINTDIFSNFDNDTPIGKAALALIKIHQLVEVGYGGNVTKEEDLNSKILKYYIGYYFGDSVNNKKAKFNIYTGLTKHSPIRFRTKEEAEEFLSYPENVQLLKDYFMI